MTGKIFINYRRGDDPGFAQLLYRHLEQNFAATNLFMDVEGHIRPGDDFVAVLRDRVQAADAMLAIIGPRWSELLIARVKDPHEFVAIEIEVALENNELVIPILVGGARMSRAELLPETIRSLVWRNAVELRPERFNTDCQGLVGVLTEHFEDVDEQTDSDIARRALRRRNSSPRPSDRGNSLPHDGRF
jgi:hypothetical protein